jgi:hypothetical protein
MRRLMLIALVVAGCHHGAEEVAQAPSKEPATDAITRTTENGPVKLTVKVWPAKPSLIDPIFVRLEIDAAAGVTVEAPFQETGERLGRFRIVGFTKDRGAGDKQVQTYELAAPASGRERIPPFRLEMIDQRAGSGGSASPVAKAKELLTEEVPLEVTPVKAEKLDAELHPALGDLDVDVGGVPWWYWVGGAGLLVMIGSGATLAFRAWRLGRKRAQQRSAYDEAIARLRGLADRGAPDAATTDGWFVELSAIVRRYLEGRYHIHAPELTTEEFLQVAAKGAALTAEHRGMLTSFLEGCDRVKFAGYRPEAAESLATLAAAQGFIEETRVRELGQLGDAVIGKEAA